MILCPRWAESNTKVWLAESLAGLAAYLPDANKLRLPSAVAASEKAAATESAVPATSGGGARSGLALVVTLAAVVGLYE